MITPRTANRGSRALTATMPPRATRTASATSTGVTAAARSGRQGAADCRSGSADGPGEPAGLGGMSGYDGVCRIPKVESGQ